jgi:chaperone modulatory protein CbpM
MTDLPPLPAAPWPEEEPALTLEELSRSCGARVEWLVEMVHEGVLDPEGEAPSDWRFRGASLRRARVGWHLACDLDVNAAGAALALELLDEIHALRLQLRSRGAR